MQASDSQAAFNLIRNTRDFDCCSQARPAELNVDGYLVCEDYASTAGAKSSIALEPWMRFIIAHPSFFIFPKSKQHATTTNIQFFNI